MENRQIVDKTAIYPILDVTYIEVKMFVTMFTDTTILHAS